MTPELMIPSISAAVGVRFAVISSATAWAFEQALASAAVWSAVEDVAPWILTTPHAERPHKELVIAATRSHRRVRTSIKLSTVRASGPGVVWVPGLLPPVGNGDTSAHQESTAKSGPEMRVVRR